MNYVEQKKLERKLIAAANKLLRGPTKKKPKKHPGAKLRLKVFAQTPGSFPVGFKPLICHIKNLKDFERRNAQLGRFEFLHNKTYYRAKLHYEGIYFFKNLQILMKKEFYFEPGFSGFISLSSEGKIERIAEEEARQAIEKQF